MTGLNVNATITANTFTSNIATGTAPFSVQSTTQVANLNVALAGNAVNLNNGTSNVVVTSSGNITFGSAGNAAIFTVTGTGAKISGTANITGNANVGNLIATAVYTDNYKFANGVAFSVDTSQILNGNSNVKVAANSNVSISANGTANVVSVSEAGATVSGNLTITGNLTINGTTTTINTTTLDVTDLNVTVAKGAASSVAANGAGITVDGASATILYNSTSDTWVFNKGANISGTANITGNANVGNLGTSGNITAGYFLGNGSQLSGIITSVSNVINGTSNVNIGSSGSNVTVGVGGTANVLVVASTGIVANTTVQANNHTASGAATGNVNVATITGNLGLRALFTTYTDNSASASATIANAAIHAFDAPNIAAANASVTLTNAATFYVAGAPVANTNVTITNPYAILVGGGNVKIAGTGAASSSTTGALQVAGGAGVAGNIYVGTNANVTGTANITGNLLAGANIVYTGNLYQGSQLRYAHAYTASTAAPSGSTLGDYWYNTTTDVLYSRVTDGGTTFWLDMSTQPRVPIVSTSGTAPVSPAVGDYWYDTGTDILSVYVNDGVSNFWMDISSQANTFSDTTTTNATITTASITTANVSGNINAANLQNGNSNLRIVASGNISASVGGTANVVLVTSTGANISGTANITGNANVGNLGTGAVVATGSITIGTYVYADGSGITARTGAGNYGLRLYPGGGSDANTSILQFTNSLQNSQYGSFAFSGSSLSMGTDVATPVAIRVNAANIIVATTGSATVTGNVLPNANVTYNLGSTTARWSNIWGLASSAQYADLAERYSSDYDYDPGTVVIFGGNAEITVTNADHDPRIAGVISTNPGYLMNDSSDQDALMLPVALTGRVPTRVRGPISKGDMVVSSTEEGVAIRMQKELYEPGCVIGKSLENISDDSIQTIEVVVGRL